LAKIRQPIAANIGIAGICCVDEKAPAAMSDRG
jgi:hypothetical protein